MKKILVFFITAMMLIGCSLTAMAEQRYLVDVNNGTAKDEAGNLVTSAVPGETIYIEADAAPSGTTFMRWMNESDDIFGDVYAPATTITMPERDIHIDVSYIDSSIPIRTIKYDTYLGDVIETSHIIKIPDGEGFTCGTDNYREVDGTGYFFKEFRTYVMENGEKTGDPIYQGNGNGSGDGSSFYGLQVTKDLVIECRYAELTEDTVFSISIQNGSAYDSEGNVITVAKPGQTVVIKADKSRYPQGRDFFKWDGYDNSLFADPIAEETEIVMPVADVSLYVRYKDASKEVYKATVSESGTGHQYPHDTYYIYGEQGESFAYAELIIEEHATYRLEKLEITKQDDPSIVHFSGMPSDVIIEQGVWINRSYSAKDLPAYNCNAVFCYRKTAGLKNENEVYGQISNAKVDGDIEYNDIRSVYADANKENETAVGNETVELIAETVDKEFSDNSKAEVSDYFDLKLFVLSCSHDEQGEHRYEANITELDDEITVYIYVDEETINDLAGKNIAIARVHDGEADIIEGELVDDALVFKTDRFSTYAVVTYDDVEEIKPPVKPAVPSNKPHIVVNTAVY